MIYGFLTKKDYNRLREDIIELNRKINELQRQNVFTCVSPSWNEYWYPGRRKTIEVSLRKAVSDIADQLGLKYEYQQEQPPKGIPKFTKAVEPTDE